MNIRKRVNELYPELVEIRREFHRHPEPALKETWTGAFVCRLLKEWKIDFKYPVADTGVVAVIWGEKSGTGRTVALRADMDALPLTEDDTCPYHSLNPGYMHACGHDAHITIALGAARILNEMKKEWSGCIKIFFQPAEETIGGARLMIEAGCMENPEVDYVTGLHVMPSHKTGDIEVRYGNLNAASDDVSIQILGRECHGAYPDTGVDAVIMAAAVINNLQTVISRNISPLCPAVLTIGTIHGGTAGNIVSGKVDMKGTLRTTDSDTREKLIACMDRTVEGTCMAMGGRGNLTITPGYEALFNTDEVVDVLLDTASEILGKEHIHMKENPSLGVEDFSFYLEKSKGVFYHLGCSKREENAPAMLHSREFHIDEECLKIGVELQTVLALRLLGSFA